MYGTWSADDRSSLTLRELQDQARLEQTLADAGVPAVVNFGRFCEPASQADNLTATTGTHFIQRPVGRDGVLVGILINPAAIPPGQPPPPDRCRY